MRTLKWINTALLLRTHHRRNHASLPHSFTNVHSFIMIFVVNQVVGSKVPPPSSSSSRIQRNALPLHRIIYSYSSTSTPLTLTSPVDDLTSLLFAYSTFLITYFGWRLGLLSTITFTLHPHPVNLRLLLP